MGWLFPYDATRQSLVEDRTKSWERQIGDMLVRTECQKHCVRGGRFRFVLWTVWRRTFMVDGSEVRPEERWIVCDLCQDSRDSEGYGYKDMTEAEHPCCLPKHSGVYRASTRRCQQSDATFECSRTDTGMIMHAWQRIPTPKNNTIIDCVV